MDWSLSEVEAFFEELYEETVAEEGVFRSAASDDDPLTAFNFVASTALGGGGGCCALDCRIQRAQLVARYAVLYADRVIVPMEFLNPRDHPRPKRSMDERLLRYDLTGTLLVIHEMRPAIEAGLIAVVNPELHFCAECASKALKRIGRINRSAQRLADETRNQFSMTFLGGDPLPHFSVRGPSEYCEHGGFIRVSDHAPAWLPKSYRAKANARLPETILRRSKIVEEVFRDVASEVVMQEFFSYRYNSKALTSNPGELALLSRLNPDSGRHARVTTSLSRVTHVIPLMEDISLAKAVRIRNQERDSFLVYRKALSVTLSEMLKSENIVTERRAGEIVSEVLEPEIAKLRGLANEMRTKSVRKAGLRLAFAGAILTLGFFRGLLPAEFSALGSAAALTGLVDSLAELRANARATRNQNFHFLLRLTQ